MTDTLIVWTESNGTDMALSFQEADGCAVIWLVVAQAYFEGDMIRNVALLLATATDRIQSSGTLSVTCESNWWRWLDQVSDGLLESGSAASPIFANHGIQP